jgi:predicted phage replisome organizer
MAEVKKYYFLKLKDDFYNSEEIKVLESMPNGIYHSNLLTKLYLMALRYDGALKLNESMAYDEKMIAALTNLDLKFVRSGLQILASLGFIEKLEDGTIYMSHMQSFVGKSSNEAERKKKYRSKIKDGRDILEQISPKYITKPGRNDGTFLDKRPPENRDIENRDLEFRDIENREKDTKDSLTSLSVSLLKDFEDRTGTIGGLNLAALKKTVELHGADNVKRAIDKALEKNKPTMTYINGILKNWAAEGYPKEGEKGGNGSSGKNNGAGSNEFAGFKPKDPRNLSDEERAALESELL